ncbi:hypothetical protein [Bacillus wiedmannii]|nr:hypothetical protein [Bacillus wiedmannii]
MLYRPNQRNINDLALSEDDIALSEDDIASPKKECYSKNRMMKGMMDE